MLGGQAIHAGDKVVLFYNSANRDEAVFADPYRFDLERSPNPHAGFRRRRAALLPRRPPGPTRDPRHVRRSSSPGCPTSRSPASPTASGRDFINGIKHLPCAFTPAA